MVAFNRRHFSRTDFSAFTVEVDHAGQILSIPLRSISTPTRSTRPFGSHKRREIDEPLSTTIWFKVYSTVQNSNLI